MESSNKKKMTRDEASNIFMQHYGFLRMIAYKNAPTKGLMDDILHDAYVYFVGKAEELYYDEKKIKALLRTIAEHMAARAWQAHLRSVSPNSRRLAEYLRKKCGENSSTEHASSNLEEKLLALKICLQKLSDENRRLLELYYHQQISYSELCRELNRSVKGVYNLMGRLRELLHNCVLKTMNMEIEDV